MIQLVIVVGLLLFFVGLFYVSTLKGEIRSLSNRNHGLSGEVQRLKETLDTRLNEYRGKIKDLTELAKRHYRNFESYSRNEFVKGWAEKYLRTFQSGQEWDWETVKARVDDALIEQYKYRLLVTVYPELESGIQGFNVVKLSDYPGGIPIAQRSLNLFEVVEALQKDAKLTGDFIEAKNKIILLQERIEFLESTQSNLTAIPYMAGIMADYETYGIERLAKGLNWGYDKRRLEKVKTIREIRRDAQQMVEKNKESQYQLAYLLNMFPALNDVVEAEFKQLPIIDVKELSDYDSSRDWLTKEEYASLSTTERNQLALDRYRESHQKTKWQIGRDYELYVGYRYSKKGYQIDYFGSYMGLEDLGRDIIAQKGNQTLIIQCKYWSSKKQIHENHVNQLYGTMVSYCIENQKERDDVKGLLVTNIELSPMAKKMAAFLGIEYLEKFGLGTYPCIKCNINRSTSEKIYHLPFDQQYDATKIDAPGEFYAMTVAEAEKAGFRRAFKYFGAK